MKSQIRVAALLLLTVVFMLIAVSVARAQTPNMVLETAGDNLSRIEIVLRTGKEPVRYEFKAEKGVIAGGIALPKSGSADYEISAYDPKGNLTHFGTGTLGSAGATDKGTVLPLGDLHACGLASQLASCIGPNAFGQLGNGTNLLRAVPVPVLAPPPLYVDISAGAAHTCGVTPDGDVFCWGANTSAQSGTGVNSFGNLLPTKVVTP